MSHPDPLLIQLLMIAIVGGMLAHRYGRLKG